MRRVKEVEELGREGDEMEELFDERTYFSPLMPSMPLCLAFIRASMPPLDASASMPLRCLCLYACLYTSMPISSMPLSDPSISPLDFSIPLIMP